MRSIAPALIAVLFAASTMAQAQEPQTRRSGRQGRTTSIWAVNHVESTPVALPPPVTTMPGPVAVHAPHGHGIPGPMVEPGYGPGPTGHVGCGHGGCGSACGTCGKRRKLCGLLDWFCYHPKKSCCKGCPCVNHPSIYVYFPPCCDGACHTVAPPPCCEKKWHPGNLFATGHSWFALPTGQGCCGIR